VEREDDTERVVPGRTSIVVVSHNEDQLESTVTGLAATTSDHEIEMIVVDDASTDSSVRCLDDLPCAVRVITTPHRIGVAGARNIGAAASTGDHLVFADAHVRPDPGWLPPLLDVLENPHVGAVAPAITPFCAATPRGLGFTWTGPDLVMRWLRGPSKEPHAVPFLCGCFIAASREAFQHAGGFDEGCSGWGLEDAELALHLWRLGYECQVVPAATVGHLFRRRFPYSMDWSTVVHNALRVAAVHVPEAGLARVIGHYRSNSGFAKAYARLAGGSTWERRDTIAGRAARDGRSVLAQFSISSLT
jgi:polypeptide N-acetylgalactosaminyltransferase